MSTEPDSEKSRSCGGTLCFYVAPYVYRPTTGRQKLVALLLWGSVIGALVYLFVWGFPKLVDHVVLPVTDKLKKELTKVQIGTILFAAVALLPLVFLSYDPAVWLAAVVLGFWICLAIVVIASAIGMAIAYFLGHKYLRDWVQSWIRKREHLQALLDAAERVGPFKLQLLLRLGPIPSPILNYASAVPVSMTWLPYMAGSILGMLPRNALGVYFGRNIKGIADLLQGESMPAAQLAYNIVGLVVSIVIVIGGYFYAKSALRQIREEQELLKCDSEAASIPQLSPRAPVHLAAASVPLGRVSTPVATPYAVGRGSREHSSPFGGVVVHEHSSPRAGGAVGERSSPFAGDWGREHSSPLARDGGREHSSVFRGGAVHAEDALHVGVGDGVHFRHHAALGGEGDVGKGVGSSGRVVANVE